MAALSYIWHQVTSLAFVVGVLGNLTASATITIGYLGRKLNRHHARLEAIEHHLGIRRRDDAV